jgi:tetratricopeptide (TPR) repeat protein
MSELSKIALSQLASRELKAALRTASQAVHASPNDWHAQYALGQCLRFTGDFVNAIEALERSQRLAPVELPVLLALGIVRQLDGQHHSAISAFQKALAIDPDYVLAINSLAMTYRLMGDYEGAAESYESAMKALARKIVTTWCNKATSERLPHADSRNSLWIEHALYSALWLTANDGGVENLSWPTAELAERDAQTHFLEGWYWRDLADSSGKLTRFFCPNFFNSFHSQLLQGQIYNQLVGNRSSALRELGRLDEAEAHLQEAEDFSL